MSIADDIVIEIFRHNKELPVILAKAIKHKLGISTGEFSKKAGIPVSTLYKILSGERDPNLRTFRRIITTIHEIESGCAKKKKFIAVICSRGVLDEIDQADIYTGKEPIDVKEYAVTTIEESMIVAIQAEKEGASALVCAPIVSPTVEKIVTLPVTTIKPKASVSRAIEQAAKKIH